MLMFAYYPDWIKQLEDRCSWTMKGNWITAFVKMKVYQTTKNLILSYSAFQIILWCYWILWKVLQFSKLFFKFHREKINHFGAWLEILFCEKWQVYLRVKPFHEKKLEASSKSYRVWLQATSKEVSAFNSIWPFERKSLNRVIIKSVVNACNATLLHCGFDCKQLSCYH